MKPVGAGPVVLGQRLRQREVPLEVRELARRARRSPRRRTPRAGARAVPEGHLAVGLQALELVEDVRAHRRHAGAAADEAHLVLSVSLAKNSPKGPEIVTSSPGFRLKMHEDIDAGRDVLARSGGEGDADVEHDDALLFRVVGHRVGALDRLVDLGLEAPEVELVPVVAVLAARCRSPCSGRVRRALDLDVAAGAERHLLALGQLQHQLLDEGGDVVVRDRTLHSHLRTPKTSGGDLDLHVLLDLDLAGEPAALARLAAGDVAGLGGQQGAAAFLDARPCRRRTSPCRRRPRG